MQTEKIKLSRLRLNRSNPRTITEEKMAKLMRSILVFPKMMNLRPIVVDDTMTALGGNMRTRALNLISEMNPQEVSKQLADIKDFQKKTEAEKDGIIAFWVDFLKDPEVNVVAASSLSSEERRQFIIKDNVGYGDWDMDMLANEWDDDELEEWGMDIWDDEQQSDKEVEEDDFDEEDVEDRFNIKEGDVIQIGDHRLICGDAANAEHYEALLDGEQFDLIVTDPPYNVDYTGGTKEALKIQNDKMDDNGFYQFLLDAFTQMHNHTKPGGAWYICHADSEGLNFRAAIKESGIQVRQCLIWVKNSMVLGRQDYQWKHEPILYGWKDGAGHYFTSDRTNTTVYEDMADIDKMKKTELLEMLHEILGDNTKSTVIHHDRPNRNAEHPTMKPVKLMGELIKNSSRENEIVGDTFAGSGSTFVASEQLSAKCYGFEIDPHYCNVIMERMIESFPDLKVIINDKPVEL